ncbi:MAG: HD domain-containing protein, partial [Epsilonproteobacteria bacterium]|nr:HD domain-containing protein [Campylobacterota bacterium]
MKMQNIDLIALAALLHDIGKFGQRADEKDSKIDDFDWQNFCPRDKNGNPTHKHAAYTAKILGDLIVEKQKDQKRIIKADSLNGKFIDISANHHKPQINEEWIIAAADRLASGFERETFKEYNEQVEEEINKNYKEQQLNHLFEKDKFPQDTLSPKNIFPTTDKGRGYQKLWDDFEKELKVINEKIPNFPEHIKVDALEYLLKKYTSFIPSATAFKSKNGVTIPNISLYEHLKTTSIFASAIASMSEEN